MSLHGKAFRQRLAYHLQRKEHYVYLVHIPGDNVGKVGRTSRLKNRLHNLRQAIYRPHEVYVICCHSAAESMSLEKALKKMLPNHISGEWYSGVTPEQVQSLLVAPDHGHLLLVPFQSNTTVVATEVRKMEPTFVIELF